MLSAFSIVSLHLISGQFCNWFSANIFLRGANNLTTEYRPIFLGIFVGVAR